MIKIMKSIYIIQKDIKYIFDILEMKLFEFNIMIFTIKNINLIPYYEKFIKIILIILKIEFYLYNINLFIYLDLSPYIKII